MGHKISSKAMRLGINQSWNSVWFSDKKNYGNQFLKDLEIRKFLKKQLNAAGLEKIMVKRSTNQVEVELHVARPGVAIGRAGAGIDQIKKTVEKIVGGKVEIKINEVKKPDLSARIVARSIADGIEKRQPVKILIQSYKQKVMMAGAKGVRISVGGRVGSNNQARTEKVSEGAVPLQTLKSEIDYAEERAQTKEQGILGVKVWINKDKK